MKETARARQAWADYLAMGPERSLEKLANSYHSRTEAVPTRQLSRLKAWSQVFGWQARLREIADRQAKEAEDREAAYRREIMEQGYSLAHERVKAMKLLAERLFEELTIEGEDNRRWVRDVKQIGSGEYARLVDIERFNASEVEQLRGLLDDIAKEKGERKHLQEITGRDGGPIEVDLAQLSDEERIARIVSILDRARARRDRPTLEVGPSMGALAGPADGGL